MYPSYVNFKSAVYAKSMKRKTSQTLFIDLKKSHTKKCKGHLGYN